MALFFNGLEKLKGINYSSLIKQHKNGVFSFKGYVLVHDSKYDPDIIDISTLPKTLSYLFLKDELDTQNLGNIIIEYDKKIYN